MRRPDKRSNDTDRKIQEAEGRRLARVVTLLMAAVGIFLLGCLVIGPRLSRMSPAPPLRSRRTPPPPKSRWTHRRLPPPTACHPLSQPLV